MCINVLQTEQKAAGPHGHRLLQNLLSGSQHLIIIFSQGSLLLNVLGLFPQLPVHDLLSQSEKMLTEAGCATATTVPCETRGRRQDIERLNNMKLYEIKNQRKGFYFN
ncbi:hypothetical protein CRENBAI_014228 [Crenichthys baileyi]|uniref:Uncharacterized protein n=1 Tax=Crenichthys baileyi TaxID=28760 RepID=A0AAV9SPY1_9TELE